MNKQLKNDLTAIDILVKVAKISAIHYETIRYKKGTDPEFYYPRCLAVKLMIDNGFNYTDICKFFNFSASVYYRIIDSIENDNMLKHYINKKYFRYDFDK